MVGAWILRGARGLRQGDPMSPYLFVLVMEVLHMILQQLIEQDGEFQYHWRCQELNLFQLSFADDLSLLCKADVRSVNLFRQGLDRFATLSGLNTNTQKSQLIISKAASRLRDSLLAILGSRRANFRSDTLVSHLFQQGFLSQIVNHCFRRLTAASKDGKESSFPLLEGSNLSNLFDLLRAWEAVCRSIEEGGLGIKDILALNRALMSKHLWAVIKQDRTSLWVEWIIQVRLRDCSIWTVKENKGAWGWRKMLSLRHYLMSHIHYRVGNGESVSLWHDPWHPLGPLISRFPRGPQLTRTGLLDKLLVVIKDGQWNWPLITDIACLEITYMLPPHFGGPRQNQLEQIPLPWPHRIGNWCSMASSRWRGKHVVNAAYRSLLASIVYHIWQERNARRFQQRSRPPSIVGRLVVEEIRQRIISIPLRHSVSSIALLPYIEFKIGNGESFSLWHDPWHSLGSLIRRFPRGPSRTNIPIATKLSAVLVDGDWSWPSITDMECIEILHLLPTIQNGNDAILWRGGEFTTKVVYDIFRILGPTVGWRVCVLCGREAETHEHLFFRCSYSRRCIRDLKATVRFSWPNRAWRVDITWATKRWKGRHVVQAAYRALLSAIVYHIWRNVITEFFSTVNGRAPLLLGLR
ncbi:hypothetical protein Sango_3035300 [Sesamum angolense]|uniref:Reverse transcriptase domain-containing protein n=1 Tax=Sesamum angolense TaxID=2727404 RepID=A0AAE1TBZ5_9LAMI|nr:hypothetical protein Sango_3035300 [Sesamum angolense]